MEAYNENEWVEGVGGSNVMGLNGKGVTCFYGMGSEGIEGGYVVVIISHKER